MRRIVFCSQYLLLNVLCGWGNRHLEPGSLWLIKSICSLTNDGNIVSRESLTLKDLIKNTKFSNKAVLKPVRTHGAGKKTSYS